MSQVLTDQDFISYVGKTFTPKGQHRVLTLTSVEMGASVNMGGRSAGEAMHRQSFTLILTGPHDDVLPEGFYDVAVANGPDFALYIAPIHTAARDRQDYQVGFN